MRLGPGVEQRDGGQDEGVAQRDEQVDGERGETDLREASDGAPERGLPLRGGLVRIAQALRLPFSSYS